jgi:hypothetical protein
MVEVAFPIQTTDIEKQKKKIVLTGGMSTHFNRSVSLRDMITLEYNNEVRKILRRGIDPKEIISYNLKIILGDVDSGKITREEAHNKFIHSSRVILDIAAEEKQRIAGGN